MASSGSNEYEESRCKFYGTTIYSCTCPGYSFRKTCRHVEFKRAKLVNKDVGHTDEDAGEASSLSNDEYGKILGSVASGDEATTFVEENSEELLDKMKVIGDVWERGGRLYRLE